MPSRRALRLLLLPALSLVPALAEPLQPAQPAAPVPLAGCTTRTATLSAATNPAVLRARQEKHERQQLRRLQARLTQLERQNPPDEHQLAATHDELGQLLAAHGGTDTARHNLQAGLEIRQRLAGREPDAQERQRELAASLDHLGVIENDAARARQHLQAALDIRRRLAEREPGNVQMQRELADSLDHLGKWHRINDAKEQNKGDALPLIQAAFEIRQHRFEREPSNPEALRDLMLSQIQLGDTVRGRRDPDGWPLPLRHYHLAHDYAQRLSRCHPDSLEAYTDERIAYSKSTEATPDPLPRLGPNGKPRW